MGRPGEQRRMMTRMRRMRKRTGPRRPFRCRSCGKHAPPPRSPRRCAGGRASGPSPCYTALAGPGPGPGWAEPPQARAAPSARRDPPCCRCCPRWAGRRCGRRPSGSRSSAAPEGGCRPAPSLCPPPNVCPTPRPGAEPSRPLHRRPRRGRAWGPSPNPNPWNRRTWRPPRPKLRPLPHSPGRCRAAVGRPSRGEHGRGSGAPA